MCPTAVERPFVCSLLRLILFIFDCTGSCHIAHRLSLVQEQGTLFAVAQTYCGGLLLWSMGSGEIPGLQWL